MKQLHRHDSYKPKHWHEYELTKKQKEQILESHIFVEQKWDGLIKARKVIGGNKQQDYITQVGAALENSLRKNIFKNIFFTVQCCRYGVLYEYLS